MRILPATDEETDLVTAPETPLDLPTVTAAGHVAGMNTGTTDVQILGPGENTETLLLLLRDLIPDHLHPSRTTST